MFSIPMFLQKLHLFNEKAEKLKRSPFMRSAFREDAGTSVHIESGTMQVEKRGANEFDTDAFVLTLRFFLQPRDGIQLEQIERLYQDAPLSGEDKHKVSENLKALNTFLAGSTNITLKGQHITNQILLDTFLYGKLAHTNKAKRAVFATWDAMGPAFILILESKFESILGQVLRLIFWLHGTNMQAIQHLETISAPGSPGTVPVPEPTGVSDLMDVKDER